MTYREYQRCVHHYHKKTGNEPVKKPVKVDPDKPYFGPDFAPVDPINVAKGAWAIRLRCLEGRK